MMLGLLRLEQPRYDADDALDRAAHVEAAWAVRLSLQEANNSRRLASWRAKGGPLLATAHAEATPVKIARRRAVSNIRPIRKAP